MKINQFFLILLFGTGWLSAQNTVGLLSYKSDKAFEGYNLIYPHNQGNTYLLNNCGEVVHIWEDGFEWHPGITAYLTPEGNLIRAKRLKNTSQDTINGGGSGAIVEIKDWENNLLWSYTLNNSKRRLHHDIAPMPNGNILVLAWEPKNRSEIVKAGRDTTRFNENRLFSEVIMEIDPKTDQVVWEWNLWDHLVQNFDNTKDNFGNVAERPGKIDINYQSITGSVTWMHANAIHYNPFLDQIMVSIPTYEEIWIIDHSTTTSQAAGSTGGLSGTGGDLMYRWGNARTYQKGDVLPQKLFFQHDSHWVLDFVSQADPNFGNIAVFNNRAGSDFSTANIFTPPWDMYEWKYTMVNGVWGPMNFYDTFTHPVPTNLFSDGLSSVQFLPNRNVLIHSGRQGYAFELTPDKQIVWEYKTPLKNGLPVTQGSTLALNDNLTFRMQRYPATFKAFEGRDLSSKGYIEEEPDIDYCFRLVSAQNEKINNKLDLKLFPNPSTGMLHFEWNKNTTGTIMDISGTVCQTVTIHEGLNTIITDKFKNGLYFMVVDDITVKAFNVSR
ncbi:MAG: aryl-sulfate sulfotransferase [Saprospiraceae bacterium]|nr:aryl-sulfate sulfotransferase [Saprospiraceae bacterium]